MNCLVPTRIAAMTVDAEEQKLVHWAAAGLVTPAEVDPHGHHMWDVEALRRQISRYVDTGDGDGDGDGDGEP